MKTRKERQTDAEQKARDIWMGVSQTRRAIDEGEDLASIRRRVNELVAQAGALVLQLKPDAH